MTEDAASGDPTDLDRWLDQLAGREATDPAMPHLRQVIERNGQQTEAELLGPLASLEAEERALQRLREESEKSRQQAGVPSKRRRPWRTWWPAAALGTMLMVGLIVPFYRGSELGSGLEPTFETPPDFRGALNVIRINDPTPRRRAEHVAASLHNEVTGLVLYVYDDKAAVDFEVTAEGLPRVDRSLADEMASSQLRPGPNRIVLSRP